MPEKKMMLRKVRLSFPNVFTAKAYENADGTKGDPKFSVKIMLNKEDHAQEIEDIQAEMERVAKETFDGKVPKKLEYCLIDGDDEEMEEYADHMILGVSTRKRPLVVDRDKSVLAEEDEKIYGGVYCNVTTSFWGLNRKGMTRRICANLRGIQFVEHGEAFGAGPLDPDDEFDDMDDMDDGGILD